MPTASSAPSARRRVAIWLCALVLGVALLALVDKSLYHRAIEFQRAYRSPLRDWMDAWGVMGWVPTWWFIAWASWRIARDRRRKGTLSANPLPPMPLAVAPALAGLLSEGAKLVARRARPAAGDGDYVFRPFNDGPFDSNGLGMPSSETSVAFAAAFVLYRAFPAAWPLWLFLALGCAAQRMLEGKHFASDTFVAALLGLACAHFVWERARRRTAGS